MLDPDVRRQLREVAEAATEGKWYWGGYTDRNGIDLRARASMTPIVLGVLRSLPCFIEDQHWQMVATKDACDPCKAMLARWGDDDRGDSADFWEGYECPRTDLPGLTFRDEHLMMHPASKWAVKEVTYRNDVVAVDQPDAAHIAAFDPPTVLSLLDALDEADRALTVAREALDGVVFLDTDAESRDIAEEALARIDTLTASQGEPT